MTLHSILWSRCSATLLLALVACDSSSADSASDAKSKAKADGVEAKVKVEGDAKEKAGDAEVEKAEAAGDAKEAADAKAGDAKAGDAKVEDAKVADAKVADADAAGAEKATDETDEAKGDDADPSAKEDGAGVPISALYWAGRVEGEGKTLVDMIDVMGEGDADPVMALIEKYEYPDGIDKPLPPDAVLPDGFAVGDAWTVATTAGAVPGKAVSFGAEGGASEGHFIVVLDAEVTGLAARASEWKGPIPMLREAKATPLAAEVRKAAWPNIVAKAEGTAKVELRRPGRWKGTLQAVEGSFVGGYTHLVSMVPPETEEIGNDHVAGLMLVDATGRVESVFAPAMTLDTYEVLYLVDLEGDGTDEVVLDSSYYEGSYRLVLAWDAAGKLDLRTLTGDGA